MITFFAYTHVCVLRDAAAHPCWRVFQLDIFSRQISTRADFSFFECLSTTASLFRFNHVLVNCVCTYRKRRKRERERIFSNRPPHTRARQPQITWFPLEDAKRTPRGGRPTRHIYIYSTKKQKQERGGCLYTMNNSAQREKTRAAIMGIQHLDGLSLSHASRRSYQFSARCAISSCGAQIKRSSR